MSQKNNQNLNKENLLSEIKIGKKPVMNYKIPIVEGLKQLKDIKVMAMGKNIQTALFAMCLAKKEVDFKIIKTELSITSNQNRLIAGIDIKLRKKD